MGRSNRHHDRQVARDVCDRHLWLASICMSPHMGSKNLLQTAAAAHLLHASRLFRLPKRACKHGEGQQAPPKRCKTCHKQPLPVSTAPAATQPQLQPPQQANQGADVSGGCGPPGRTALHAAAEAGSAAGVRALLDQGADSYRADDCGVSPLMLAAAGGHAEAVQALLEAGADPFHVDYSGVNPLMCAARCGSSPCIQLLLAEGVDADYANTELGDGQHALLLAAQSGSVPAVRLLLEAGARLNRTDKAGRTALWVAAREGHGLLVQLLLSQPGVKHIRSHGGSSTTPLEEARAAHHATCVALLETHLHQQLQQADLPASRVVEQQLQQQQQRPRRRRCTSKDRAASAGPAMAH